MVNSRPITAVASGADEVEALSPANLLFGYKGKTIIPEHLSKPKRSADSDKVVFSRRWKYQQRLLSSFWRRYHEEYLQYLKTAHKPISARPLKIGDVCLLQGESFNRALWPLCRVISFPENVKPENARSCFIRTAKGQTNSRGCVFCALNMASNWVNNDLWNSRLALFNVETKRPILPRASR
ncbi:uncharacterized protein LOC108864994 [Galendromus occidentalis]|uniref:Uncharacterized protein LOC108864994 n=1 Tax=Galendromus occidentalis TaxID=34638 RepID=A0AAJ7L8E8_9ACAR|nr:uncharacterized protein LOC108864994 [Galendromus occidentalis]